MSAVGIFILLLVAFLVLHRWYARPSARARRMRSARGHDGGRPPATLHSRPGAPHARGDGAPGANLAATEGVGSVAGTLGAAAAVTDGGSHGGAGASGSVGAGSVVADGTGDGSSGGAGGGSSGGSGSGNGGSGGGNGGGNGGSGSGDGD